MLQRATASDARNIAAARGEATLRAGAAAGPRASPALRDADAQADIWAPVLRRLGLARGTVRMCVQSAARNRTSFVAELLARELVAERAFYEAAARELGIDYVPVIAPGRLVLDERSSAGLLSHRDGIRVARVEDGEGHVMVVMAPEARDYRRLSAALAAQPEMRGRIAIVAPGVLRKAVVERCRGQLAAQAVDGLSEALPHCSARTTFTQAQAFFAGVLLTAVLAAFIAWPAQALLTAHVSLIACFIPCVVLRLLATRVRRGRLADLDRLPPGEMPCYTVLVALHREAEVIPSLLVALGRLEWPRAKLEIKLVCEADDAETLAVIEAQRLRPFVEVVKVPSVGPRTKPKALAYALQLSRGELVALYDAEDRPHPRQLLEAWSRLRQGDQSLACVQAPLLVSNRSASIIARMFAFEYAGLFRAVLPFLSRNGLILPLGGTSNHFRRSVLDKIGGWDPFNVTEDADLGLRMKRFGYRTETISLPTLEAAPVRFGVWLPQRTRWFKGWAQTWLVHMRSPRRLAAELGPASFVVSQILFAGMLLSALAHPLLMVTVLVFIAEFALAGKVSIYDLRLLAVDLALVGAGYVGFIAVGARSLPVSDQSKLPLIALATPLYWMMLSLAGWRAVIQLLRTPHHWEKTPHHEALGTDTPAAIPRATAPRGSWRRR